MAVILDHVPVTFQPGSRTAQANLPGGDRTILLRLARKTSATPTFWADGVSFTLTVDVSTDGGSTWATVAGFSAEGGIIPDKNGNEMTESRIGCTIPAEADRVRASLQIAGGAFTSQITVEAS